MIAPVYLDFVRALQALMQEAHGLELYRTTEQLHTALNTARTEMFEVPSTGGSTPPEITVDFAVGPIREQPKGGA
jgi:hypothetical protein